MPATAPDIAQKTEDTMIPTEVRFNHVLVPLDGSNRALDALPTAHALAERFGAEIHAISVAKSDHMIKSLRAVGKFGVEADVDDGRMVVASGVDPAAAIIGRARELGSCLVCMATNNRGRLGGAAFGSVSRSILPTTGPIVAVGSVADQPIWSASPPRWPTPLTTPRIVACVDGSAESEAVLPVATGWARALDMSLTILSFIDDAPAPLRPRVHADRYGSADGPVAYLQDLAARWRDDAPDIHTIVIPEPIGPASGLRQYLARHPAGLVAVSTSSRSGLRRLLRGSATDKMLRASTAPCLVVPQPAADAT